jgi:predicted nuclease of predicted toxin-antitoxin system
MKFVADENFSARIITRLRVEGHEVISVALTTPSAPDSSILDTAFAEQAIVITEDKDFGELVYRDRKPHCGVILVRLDGYDVVAKGDLLLKALVAQGENIPGAYCVLSSNGLRIRPMLAS